MKPTILFMGAGPKAFNTISLYLDDAEHHIGDGSDVAALIIPDTHFSWLLNNSRMLCTFIVLKGHDVPPPASHNSNTVIVRTSNGYRGDEPVTFVMRVNVQEAKRSIRSKYIQWILNTHRVATSYTKGYSFLHKIIGEITPSDDISNQHLWSLAAYGYIPPVFYVGRRIFIYEVMGNNHSLKIGASCDEVIECVIKGTINNDIHKRCRELHGFQSINQYVIP